MQHLAQIVLVASLLLGFVSPALAGRQGENNGGGAKTGKVTCLDAGSPERSN
jgi:hypothetical protein